MPAPAPGTTIQLPGGRNVPIGIDPNSQPGTPSNLTGTTPAGYDPAYGGVPIIPDPTASAWQAIGGDLSSLPQLFTLGNAYNLFNFGQQQQELGQTPGYSNVLDLMHGKLPQDVIDRVSQSAAERGVMGGTPGSPNSDAAYLSALGLTSLDAQKLGQSEYGSLAGLYPMGAPFNVNEFLTTPADQQAANTAANVSAAAPNPAAAAAAEQKALLDAIAAGKGSVPGVGPIGSGGGGDGGISGSLTTPPPSEVLASGPNTTVNRGTAPWTGSVPGRVSDLIQQALQMGPNPMQGPVINPSTGAAAGGYQGPGIDPWSGATDQWWNDPNNLLPFDGDTTGLGAPTDWSFPDQGMTNPSQSDWWNASDPWAALTGTDWTQPPPADPGIPDWAALPGEDYYGP